MLYIMYSPGLSPGRRACETTTGVPTIHPTHPHPSSQPPIHPTHPHISFYIGARTPPPQAATGCHRLPQAATGRHRLPQADTGRHRLLRLSGSRTIKINTKSMIFNEHRCRSMNSHENQYKLMILPSIQLKSLKIADSSSRIIERINES